MLQPLPSRLKKWTQALAMFGTLICLILIWAGQERRRHDLADLSTLSRLASTSSSLDDAGISRALQTLTVMAQRPSFTRAERELFIRADAHLTQFTNDPHEALLNSASVVLAEASSILASRLAEETSPTHLWAMLGGALVLLSIGLSILDSSSRGGGLSDTLSGLLATAVGSTDEGILITDTGGSDGTAGIAFANQSFKVMAGVPDEDLVGHPISYLREASLRESEFSLLEHSCSDSKSATMETVRWKDGSKIQCEWHISPVRHHPEGRVTHYISILRDITKLREHEETQRTTNEKLVEANRRLVENQQQLIHSEKMAFLGQMAAGIAHEINNPVAYIASNLETLIDDLEALHPATAGAKLPPGLDAFLAEAREIFQGSIAGLDRVKDIVQGLKNFAHPADDTVEAADINEEIENALKIVWNELKHKCEVKKELGVLPPLRCRPGQLSQVLTNLIANAAQAIPKRGQVIVSSQVNNGEIIIRVSDDGEGIPDENLNRLFTPFFTTKPAGKGTGLGLSISYGIVENHGGVIEVDSRSGQGSTFTVRLPLQNPRGIRE